MAGRVSSGISPFCHLSQVPVKKIKIYDQKATLFQLLNAECYISPNANVTLSILQLVILNSIRITTVQRKDFLSEKTQYAEFKE